MYASILSGGLAVAEAEEGTVGRTLLTLREVALGDDVSDHPLDKRSVVLVRAAVVGERRLVNHHARLDAITGQILRGEVEVRLYG